MSIPTDLYLAFSGQMDAPETLAYITAELLMGTVALHPSVAPACLWLRLAGHCETPAWLLTPDIYGTVWLGVARSEEEWAKGKQSLDRMTEMWRRWGLIETFAEEAFGPADLDAAKGNALRGKGRKLCPPPLYCWHPWEDPTHTESSQCPIMKKKG